MFFLIQITEGAFFEYVLPISSLFLLAVSLFLVGLLGIVYNHKNFIILLMSVEVMFLGISLHFIILSFLFDDAFGALVALLILAVAAAELAIGLAV